LSINNLQITWAIHASVVQAMILPSWSRISWPMFPDRRIENGSWIAHSVEDASRFVNVPNPEIRSRMSAGALGDVALGMGLRAGSAVIGAQAESFEPLADDVAADTVEPAKVGEG
jgi:hypothetical protein